VDERQAVVLVHGLGGQRRSKLPRAPASAAPRGRRKRVKTWDQLRPLILRNWAVMRWAARVGVAPARCGRNADRRSGGRGSARNAEGPVRQHRKVCICDATSGWAGNHVQVLKSLSTPRQAA